MHRFEHFLITVDDHDWRSAAFDTVARDDADESFVGVGVDEAFYVEHVAEYGVGEHEDAFDDDDVAWFDGDGFCLTCAGEVGIGRHFDGFALFELFEMLHEEGPFDGSGLVEIDFRAFFDGHMAGVLVVVVLRKHGDFTGREAVNDFVYDGSFARTGAPGDTNN